MVCHLECFHVDVLAIHSSSGQHLSIDKLPPLVLLYGLAVHLHCHHVTKARKKAEHPRYNVIFNMSTHSGKCMLDDKFVNNKPPNWWPVNIFKPAIGY